MCSRKSFESPVTLTHAAADLPIEEETPLPPAEDGETRVEGAVPLVQTDEPVAEAAAAAAVEVTELTIDAEEVEAIAADEDIDLTHVKVVVDCSESYVSLRCPEEAEVPIDEGGN